MISLLRQQQPGTLIPGMVILSPSLGKAVRCDVAVFAPSSWWVVELVGVGFSQGFSLGFSLGFSQGFSQ